MLLGGIALGLIAGLLAGGSLSNLVAVRLRWMAAIFAALLVRYGTELLISRGVAVIDQLRLPLFGGALGLLLAALWVNRRQPGMSLAFVGILSNTLAIVINGGRMPILLQSLEGIGLGEGDANTPYHTILRSTDADFLRRLGPLTDIIPIPIIRDVGSIGDVFLGIGLAFFLFATVVRAPDEPDELDEAVIQRRLEGLGGAAGRSTPEGAMAAFGPRIRPDGRLATGIAESVALDRSLVLSDDMPGLLGPVLGPLDDRSRSVAGASAAVGTLALRPAVVGRRPTALERARRHPYVRLALNSAFSALWVGNVISLFGDRVHQVALAFLVYGITGSPIAIAATFIAATLPNLLLGPVAGTLVDRWNQKDVLIVSDVLRAAAVLMIPVAAMVNVFLVYPLVFGIT